jgi:hypothetical protein
LPVLGYIVQRVLAPGLLYLTCFALLTYPLITHLSTDCFCRSNDGLQNVWNLWWVNFAVTQLHQLPWQTSYLHYPYGVSLLGQTLNPFNGFIGIPLSALFTLTQTYDLIVIFSFVSAGVTTFLLAHHLTRSYLPSLVAGFIFTFSSYHFAQAQAHLQLTSLEWIPLFLLFWYRVIHERRVVFAVESALALFLVILCDYYYFLYCVLAAVPLLLYQIARDRRRFLVTWTSYLVPLSIFSCLAAVLTGPLVVSLLLLNQRDPLLGVHAPTSSPVDVFALVIPGSKWRFAELTRGFWAHLPANLEVQVSIGIAVLILVVYASIQRKRLAVDGVGVWYLLALVFAALSLGPMIHIWGAALQPPFPMPYTVLAGLIPALSLGGVPARMMVMTLLCAAVVAAAGYELLLRMGGKGRVAAALLLVALVVESLPGRMAASRLTVPDYIRAMERARPAGAMLDLADEPGESLYFQTSYKQPQAFGYISRVPSSVFARDNQLMQWAREMRGDVLSRRYHFRYLIVPEGTGYVFNRRIYHGGGVDVFELGDSGRHVRIEGAQTLAQVPAGELLPDHLIGQTFTAQDDGLRGFGVMLSTYDKRLEGRVVMHLQTSAANGRRTELYRWTLDMRSVSGNTVRIFTFPAIKHSRGRRYSIYLEAPHAQPGHTITAWASAADAYSGGTLEINHQPAPGDLVLELYYAK